MNFLLYVSITIPVLQVSKDIHRSVQKSAWWTVHWVFWLLIAKWNLTIITVG